MELTTKVFVLIVSLCAQLSFAAPLHAEIRIADGALAQEALVPIFEPKERPLALISCSQLIVEGKTVGKVLVYDDPTTKRPVDYFELYDSTGDLVAIGWFDRFGIRRMILDRGFLHGDVFIFMGASGCGKSTLLRHLIGLEEPAQGEIFYGDENFTKADPARREEMLRRMGILFQSGALWSSMTLAENVGLPLEEFTDLRPAEIREIAFLKLALVGLKGFEDYYPSEISGGMQKRASLARAMALDPEILMLDEPSAGLDPVSSRLIDELILELRDSLGATIVIGTHMKEGEGTLASARAVIDPESITFYELTKSLHEVSGAARSLRLLADYLERNPRALIFGKPEVKNGE